MAMMLVLYQTPADQEAFEKHYFDIHVPLAMQLPGLRKYEVNDGPIIPITGDAAPYRIGVLHFDSMDSIRQAFASEIGKACAADRRLYAPTDRDVQIVLLETRQL